MEAEDNVGVCVYVGIWFAVWLMLLDCIAKPLPFSEQSPAWHYVLHGAVVAIMVTCLVSGLITINSMFVDACDDTPIGETDFLC